MYNNNNVLIIKLLKYTNDDIVVVVHALTSINIASTMTNNIIIIMLPFRHPFTSIVSGLTGSGKTQFVMRLIDSADVMIEPTPRKIVYYFAEYQTLFERYEDCIEFRQGMPKADAINRLTNTLVVYDDLIDEADKRG